MKLVNSTVRITVEQESSPSGMLKYSIINSVPISVRMPENSELSDEDTMLEILSASHSETENWK